MENRYKVELWIKELEDKIQNSNLLDFKTEDSSSLRIVSNLYEDIFSYLCEDNPIRIINLDLTNKTVYKAIEEYLYSTSEDKRSLIFSTSDKKEQKEILDKLNADAKISFENHSYFKLFITFGLLDYYDQETRHKVKSAPLVFIPISLEYLSDKKCYKIRQKNKEIFLNNVLIDFLRKSKKIDIDFPLNDKFSIVEYLNFVAAKVHLLHYSVNNSMFISTFDLETQNTLKDIIEAQEKIIDLPLVKNITHYNSEFLSFKKNSIALNKKILTVLPLDNEEYRILQRITNRESLFVRFDSNVNKIHLFNSILSSFLLNNKKVLITYDNQKEKELFLNNLDPLLLPYFVELNKNNTNKDVLLNRLDTFDVNHLSKNLYDENTTQEILNNYYNIKNNFKKIINILRKKSEKFSLSLNDAIELYYKFDCNMLDISFKHINDLTLDDLNEYLTSINSFQNTLQKLGCYYKDHPFYGFNKKSMMQEDFIPLRNAALNLNKSIETISNVLNNFEEEFNLPKINNLKLTKALLNIFSTLDLYKDFDSNLFLKDSWNTYYDTLSKISLKSDELLKLEKIIKINYGKTVFDIPNELKNRISSNKPLTKKEIKLLKNYITTNSQINLDLLTTIIEQINETVLLKEEISKIKSEIPTCFKPYLNKETCELENLNQVEEASYIIHKSIKYMEQNSVEFSYENLSNLKNNNLIETILNKRKNLQKLFNDILEKTNIIKEYFDDSLVDFSILSFEEYYQKMDNISKNFVSINDYLDFLLTLWKTNKTIKGLGDSLLKERDYSKYEQMFCKKFYYEYAINIINSFSDSLDSNTLFKNIDLFNKSEDNRKILFDSIVKNNFIDLLRANIFSIKKFEMNYLEEERKSKHFLPLEKITDLARESIYHRIPLVMVSLKELSSILKSDIYQYDAVIVLSDRNLKTKNTLNAIYRSDQVIVFDNEFIKKDTSLDFIDPYDVELFVSASKRCFHNINFIANTYKNIPLQINKKNIYIKKYIFKKLIEAGFKVSIDQVIENISVDFVVKVPSKTGLTAISINRLPYYSIESAKESIQNNEMELSKHGYFFLNIFPYAFFKDEEKELNYLINTILNNALKTPYKKTKVIKRKLTDALFETYITPRELYHTLDNKNNFTRKELFYKIIYRTAPVKKDEILSIFSHDGQIFYSLLLKDKTIYEKDGFIYIKNKPIEFKSFKNKDGRIRNIDSVSNEEIQDAIIRILNYTKQIDISLIIPMILASLGYNTMNAKIYSKVEENVINLAKNETIILTEGILSIKDEKIDDSKDGEITISRT